MLPIPYHYLPHNLVLRLCEVRNLATTGDSIVQLQQSDESKKYTWSKLGKIFSTNSAKMFNNHYEAMVFDDLLVFAAIFQITFTDIILELDNYSIAVYAFFAIRLIQITDDIKIKYASFCNESFKARKDCLLKYDKLDRDIFYLSLDSLPIWSQLKKYLEKVFKHYLSTNVSIIQSATLDMCCEIIKVKHTSLEKNLRRLLDVLNLSTVHEYRYLIVLILNAGNQDHLTKLKNYYLLFKYMIKYFITRPNSFHNIWFDALCQITDKKNFYTSLFQRMGFVFPPHMAVQKSGRIAEVFPLTEKRAKELIFTRVAEEEEFFEQTRQDLCFTRYNAYFLYSGTITDVNFAALPFLPISLHEKDYYLTEQKEEVIYLNPSKCVSIPFTAWFQLRPTNLLLAEFTLTYQNKTLVFNEDHLANIYHLLFLYPETQVRNELQKLLLAGKLLVSNSTTKKSDYFHDYNYYRHFDNFGYAEIIEILKLINTDTSLLACQNYNQEIQKLVAAYSRDDLFLLYYLEFDDQQQFFLLPTITAEMHEKFINLAASYLSILESWFAFYHTDL